MNNVAIVTLILASLMASLASAEMGVPIQLRLKSPSGTYPTSSGLTFRLLILTPTGGCVLRDESFSEQTITNGSVSLNLGSGVRGAIDPTLSLNQVYDNSKSKTGLSCVDANNTVVSTGQTYNPTSVDQRIIRIDTVIDADTILVNFNMRATPYAIQAESVGGKIAADIVVNDATTQMNQTNLNDLLLDATRFNNLKNIATSGQATSATNFTGSLAGDLSGSQGATSVDRIKGTTVSAAASAAGQFLIYDGTTQYAPLAMSGDAAMTSGGVVTIGSGAVTSGKILDATIINADVSATAAIDATKIGGGAVDNTEYSYLNGVTSALQTQLNSKLNLSGGTMTGTLITRAPTAAAGTASLKIPAGTTMTTPEAGAVESNGTSLYYTDNTAVRRTIPLRSVIKKTVTQNVFDSTILVNDNAFTFIAAANTEYHIKLVIKVSTNGTQMKLKWTFVLPSGAMEVSGLSSNASVQTAGSWVSGASGTLSSPIPSLTNTTNTQVYIIEGLISVGVTGGAVTLQWAQDVAEVENLSFMAGSFMIYEPL